MLGGTDLSSFRVGASFSTLVADTGCLTHTLSCKFWHNAWFIDQSLQVVEDGWGVPDVVALPQQIQLILTLVAQSASVLLERLELVDKFINHVPQPAVWQLYISTLVSKSCCSNVSCLLWTQCSRRWYSVSDLLIGSLNAPRSNVVGGAALKLTFMHHINKIETKDKASVTMQAQSENSRALDCINNFLWWIQQGNWAPACLHSPQVWHWIRRSNCRMNHNAGPEWVVYLHTGVWNTSPAHVTLSCQYNHAQLERRTSCLA